LFVSGYDLKIISVLESLMVAMPRRVLSLLLIQIAKIHASDNLESKRKGVRSENSGSEFFTWSLFLRNSIETLSLSHLKRNLGFTGFFCLQVFGV